MNIRSAFIGLITVSILFLFSSCERCQTMLFCPKQNPTYFFFDGKDSVALFVPNFFSPNGDGVNDHFILFSRNIKDIECKIYDGAIPIKTVHLSETWDGKMNGEVHLKVYLITVKAITNNNQIITFDGTLSAVGGEFMGDKSQHIENGVHTQALWENIQAPFQNNWGRFDPSFPNGEYILHREVNRCGVHTMD